MATSFYFQKNNYSEQSLLEDLTVESIKINGMDCYYLPRTIFNKDQIFEEDVLSLFKRGYFIELYLKNIEGFGGQKDILTKFGVEIREQATFVMARRRFDEEILPYEPDRKRPQEGDLIFFPMNNGLYEIVFVDHDSPFYQLGRRYVYEFKCEKFEYSSERLQTGIKEIDAIETNYSLVSAGLFELTTNDNNMIITESGDIMISETFHVEDQEHGAQNEIFETESESIIDFSETNPFSENI